MKLRSIKNLISNRLDQYPLRTANGRMLVSAVVRLSVLPISGASLLLTTRLVNAEFGSETFALFTIVAALPFLIPVADLGVGAAVTNYAAAVDKEPELFQLAISRAQRILLLMAGLVTLISAVISASGSWSYILGSSLSMGTEVAVGIAMAVYAVALPMSVWSRVLVGINKNAALVAVQGTVSVFNLAAVYSTIQFGLGSDVAVAGSMVGLPVTSLFCMMIAKRSAVVRSALAARVNKTDHPPVNLVQVAAPMLVISVAIPITFQADRLILSHVLGLKSVAVYSAAALVFLPVYSVVQAAGRSLWGDFAKIRSDLNATRTLFLRSLVLSFFIGIVGAAGLLLVGPTLSNWATGGIIAVPMGTYWAFASLVIVQSVHNPASMVLTDAKGLRFQAAFLVLMCIVSLPASIWAAGMFGPAGVVFACGFSVALCALVPCVVCVLVRTSSVERGFFKSGL